MSQMTMFTWASGECRVTRADFLLEWRSQTSGESGGFPGWLWTVTNL